MELAPDRHFGSYRLISRIGAGGMGEVWLAEDSKLGRTVAIKVLPPAFSKDPDSRARFFREARTAAQLNHPCIATIHAIDEVEDRPFIVMEYVTGEPLGRLIRTGLSEADICMIGARVAEALHEAHAAGIVHRDIKPDNVIVSGNRVKVLDFGIAKKTGVQATSIRPDDPTGFVTETGMILGTVHYMSPEQALGRPLDGRTDIFSLGVVLYQALTGVLPFQGESMTDVLTRIIRDDPHPLTSLRPDVSPPLAEIVARCLAKDREKRPTTGHELSAALERAAAFAATSREAGVTGTQAVTVPGGTAPMSAADVSPTDITAIRTKAGVTVNAIPAAVTASQDVRRGRSGLRIGAIAVATVLFIIAGVAVRRNMGSKAKGSTNRGVAAAPVTKAPSNPAPAEPSSGEASTAAPSETVVDVAGAPATSTETPTIVETPKESPAPAPPPVAAAPVETPAETSTTVTVSDLDARYAQAMARIREGRYPVAVAILEDILIRDPNYSQAHVRLGQMQLVRGNDAGARSHFQQALAHPDQMPERDRRLAEMGLALANDETEKAKTLAAAYEADYPNDPAFAEYKAALQRSMQGLPPKPPRRPIRRP